MIAPQCAVPTCGKELDKYGGLLISPPEKDGRHQKIHVCVKCWNDILMMAGIPLC